LNVVAKMIEQTSAKQEVKAIIKAKCPDCDAELDVPADIMQGEILSCPSCGLELEVKKVNGRCVDLQELTIEGEDWGE
jgi:alpha-aminoadipate carrier protein LysW